LFNPSLASVPVYLALSKKQVSIEQLKLIDDTLKDIHLDGTMKMILENYLRPKMTSILNESSQVFNHESE